MGSLEVQAAWAVRIAGIRGCGLDSAAARTAPAPTGDDLAGAVCLGVSAVRANEFATRFVVVTYGFYCRVPARRAARLIVGAMLDCEGQEQCIVRLSTEFVGGCFLNWKLGLLE
jgi:hypothetical protein